MNAEPYNEQDLSPYYMAIVIMPKENKMLTLMKTEEEILDMFEDSDDDHFFTLLQSEYIGPCPFAKRAKVPGQLMGPPELEDDEYPCIIERPLFVTDIEQLAKHRKLKPMFQDVAYCFFDVRERVKFKNTYNLYAQSFGIEAMTEELANERYGIMASLNSQRRMAKWSGQNA